MTITEPDLCQDRRFIEFRASGQHRRGNVAGTVGVDGTVVRYRLPSSPAQLRLYRVDHRGARRLTIAKLGSANLFDPEAMARAAELLELEDNRIGRQLLAAEANAAAIAELDALLATVPAGQWIDVPAELEARAYGHGRNGRPRRVRMLTAADVRRALSKRRHANAASRIAPRKPAFREA